MTEPEFLSETLIALLVDPEDKQPLWYFAGRSLLYNNRSRRVYEVRNNIPILLANEARQLDDDEVVELEASLGEAVETGGGGVR